MNPALAPRQHRCGICKQVAAVEHVALLMYDEDLNALPSGPVVDYLKSIGMEGERGSLVKRVAAHRKHIDAWVERGGRIAPAHEEGNVVRVPPPSGSTRWIDVSQNAMDIGNDALRELNVRLASGEMDTTEVLALARIGVSAAQARGSLEQKGKALSGIDRLLQLAAGRPQS